MWGVETGGGWGGREKEGDRRLHVCSVVLVQCKRVLCSFDGSRQNGLSAQSPVQVKEIHPLG